MTLTVFVEALGSAGLLILMGVIAYALMRSIRERKRDERDDS